jgi:hypothetical protein
MTRDTALAIWYRRLDPGCFTNPHSSADADTRPAMEVSTGEPKAPETTVYASTAVSDHWPNLAGDRRGWSVEAVADRL